MEQLDFYKGLLDEISDGVYFINRERVVTYWNNSAAELSGYTAAEVIGRRCADNVWCTSMIKAPVFVSAAVRWRRRCRMPSPAKCMSS